MTAAAANRRAAFLSVALLAAIALLACARAGGAPLAAGGAIVPGEVVAKFAPVGAGARLSALRAVDARGGRSVAGLPGTRTVELPPGETVAAALRRLRDEPGIRWAEPNYLVQLAELPDDPRLGDLWGMRNSGQTVQGAAGRAGVDVGAAGAWERTTGSGGVRVAVVDSGIEADHPDLAGNLNESLGRNFVRGGAGTVDPDAWGDTNGHGTHVAGTVGAVGDNGLGVVGVNWDVDLVPVRVCGLAGGCESVAIAEGLAYAGEVGAEVANASLGGPKRSLATEAAIAAHPETLYVVAAGNDGDDVDTTSSYPCDFSQPNLICVAAIDSSGELAEFSNFGAANVDVGAPGVGVLSSYLNLSTRFDGSGGIGPWTPEPADRWTYYSGAGSSGSLDFLDSEKPLPPESTLTSEGFDLGGGRDCRLTFGLVLDTTEKEQVLYVEGSDNGAGWTEVQPAGGYSGETQPGQVAPVTLDLGAFDGAEAARVRFRLAVAGAAEEEDAIVYLFQPRVACIDPQPASGSYAFEQGTSMASPHVAGAAALGWSAHPDTSVAAMREALLDSAVPTDSLAGVTATGGRADAAALLAALEPEPEPPAPKPGPEPTVRPGWALGLPAARRVPVTARGRALVRLRCRAARVRGCVGRAVLVGVVRTRRGPRRAVLGARRYALAADRRALRPAWLRPRLARLLRAGRIGPVVIRIATRQPANADPRVRVRAARVALRPPRRR